MKSVNKYASIDWIKEINGHMTANGSKLYVIVFQGQLILFPD